MNRLWLKLESVSPHWPSVDVSRCEGRLMTGGSGGDTGPPPLHPCPLSFAQASDGVFLVWQ